MGGGGGDSITNTGLGDDQYQTLADNQGTISGQIGDARTDADKAYENIYGKFSSQNKARDKQYKALQKSAADNQKASNNQLKALNKQNAGLTKNLGAANKSLGTLNKNVTGGFADMDTGFSDLGKDVAGVQSDVTQGFKDQATGFDDLSGNVLDAQKNINTNTDSGLETVTEDFNKGFAAQDTSFENAASDRTALQKNILDGQGDLDTDIAAVANSQDIYAQAALDNQDEITSNQSEYKTSFDGFVDRYGQDTELAQQSRADLATAQSNQTDRLREDLGSYAQATATGQNSLGNQLSGVAEGIGSNIQGLGSDVQGGFSDVSTDVLQGQTNLTGRIGNVRNLLQATGEGLDATTREQYSQLSSSFDSNGELIRNSIAQNGDTITREMDDQGNIIESRFNSTGQQVGKVSMNVDQMLSNAEQYQQEMRTQIGGFSSELAGQRDTFNNANIDLQRNLLGGMENLDAGQIKSARDMATIAANQTDLDMNMRQSFMQLGSAFDDNGQLIQNTIDAQGNTISRAVDEQGNLLLRTFDATGNVLGNKVININRALNDLAGLQNVAGSNASMGNLSPAMSSGVPTGGFASPFSTTGGGATSVAGDITSNSFDQLNQFNTAMSNGATNATSTGLPAQELNPPVSRRLDPAIINEINERRDPIGTGVRVQSKIPRTREELIASGIPYQDESMFVNFPRNLR